MFFFGLKFALLIIVFLILTLILTDTLTKIQSWMSSGIKMEIGYWPLLETIWSKSLILDLWVKKCKLLEDTRRKLAALLGIQFMNHSLHLVAQTAQFFFGWLGKSSIILLWLQFGLTIINFFPLVLEPKKKLVAWIKLMILSFGHSVGIH